MMSKLISIRPVGILIGATLILLLVSQPCAAADYRPVYTSIDVGGTKRHFAYYVPDSYDPGKPIPLLFMFHGLGGDHSEKSGGSAENKYYGWQSSAHKNGFIVLFPDSLKGTFGKHWDIPFDGSDSSMDLPFIDEMLVWAKSKFNISTSQIFTTGHSFGAFFSYYVARWRSNDIAAFAEHSGGLKLGGFFSVAKVPSGPSPKPKLHGILLHAPDDGLARYSSTQDLYDQLVANKHNVYEDGEGKDGIIEVKGWGPDKHRYRLAHNQTQWDFFMKVAPMPTGARLKAAE